LLTILTTEQVILLLDADKGAVQRSPDGGATWKAVDQIPAGAAWDIYEHPFDTKRGLVISEMDAHYITEDSGETWRAFNLADGWTPNIFEVPVAFHAEDPNKMIFQAQKCRFGNRFDCEFAAFYTLDGFKTSPTKLLDDADSCIFARSTDAFRQGPIDQILCTVIQPTSLVMDSDRKLMVSSNFFKDDGIEPILDNGRSVKGIAGLATVKSFIIAAVKSHGTDEMALYVTDDAEVWSRAQFPDEYRLNEHAYTILESTNYSIQVDVLSSRPMSAMGSLFTSNSNGTYFTRNLEHTNRNIAGLVDFEKISNIQGIILANTVSNWPEVEQSAARGKKIKSQISFDDGHTWQALKTKDGEEVHVHSVTGMSNGGRVFSSPAPGIVMGIGNTGEYLMPYVEGDLYVSDDAGITWLLAQQEAHKYEFGDQGAVIMAIYDEGPTDQIVYSLDHGHNWKNQTLPDGVKIVSHLLTTQPDSTSLKFALIGSKPGPKKGRENIFFQIDFEGMHERKCGKTDFEDWPARLNEEGKPDCLMGYTQSYLRRKWDADCFVEEEFKDPVLTRKKCTCTDEDFECDYNFKPVWEDNKKKCVVAGKMVIAEGECKDPAGTYKGSSGWRRIPGNDCDTKGGSTLGDLVDRPCTESSVMPADGKISHEMVLFDAANFKEFYYLERAEHATGDDETIIMRTDKKVYISKNHGKEWNEIKELIGEGVVAIYPHEYQNDVIFFITGSKKVFYTVNRGVTVHSFETLHPPNIDHLAIMHFHPKNKDWLIWIGAKDCEDRSSLSCNSAASYSTNRGESWQILLPNVKKCSFMYNEQRANVNDELIYCEHFEKEETRDNNPIQLVSSDDWFVHKKTHFEDIIAYATMNEFIIVAAKDEKEKTLRVDASVDARTFADAQFPPNFKVPHQQAYTVLDSSTHSVFLHVTVNTEQDREYGSIIKSNSNGTSYVLSQGGVNRDTDGYIDFEKMQGLEGVALLNVVANIDGVGKGQPKELKTMITHNDGADWGFLPPPEKDSEHKPYACSGSGIDKCSVHLHGYTERNDPRDTYSSASAVGLMMGVGNVGDKLGRKGADTETFITRNGGLDWKAVIKGVWQWEYGDQGSIIVIVKENEPTNYVYYSEDEGDTWIKYSFSAEEMLIKDITTVPSDTSRMFLLWGQQSTARQELATINLDFTGLTDKKCVLDENDPEGGDYLLWTPKHPLSDDNCLFGHVQQFHRKRIESKCYNGKNTDQLHDVKENCTCSRRDFEW
jgi:Sortilin, neurotensin receptor 3,/Sortilin, neurotensin receptor 3, C-terminal